jgi:hypothetical protein
LIINRAAGLPEILNHRRVREERQSTVKFKD